MITLILANALDIQEKRIRFIQEIITERLCEKLITTCQLYSQVLINLAIYSKYNAISVRDLDDFAMVKYICELVVTYLLSWLNSQSPSWKVI